MKLTRFYDYSSELSFPKHELSITLIHGLSITSIEHEKQDLNEDSNHFSIKLKNNSTLIAAIRATEDSSSPLERQWGTVEDVQYCVGCSLQ